MGNLSDSIERYLKALIDQSPDQVVVVKRRELAYKFNCVPSQINYVLSTRFTRDQGYLVRSRRGGGGYIEIKRLNLCDKMPVKKVTELIGEAVSENEAKSIIIRLHEEDLLNKLETDLLLACIKRESLPVPLPLRDKVRAILFKNVLFEVLKHK